MSSTRILVGDVRERLREVPDGSVQTCVTSPPYWGLRDYGCDGQIGLEQTPEEYVAEMVAVFREVRRCLRDDGTLWLNIGDSYCSHDPGGYRPGEFLNPGGRMSDEAKGKRNRAGTYRPDGLKPKDLVGIPWRLAFALQADGWFLRSDIIWAKPNPMPESVRDRPTKAHEYVFLLSKSGRYFWDADDIRQPHAPKSLTHRGGGKAAGKAGRQDALGKVASGNYGDWDKARVIDERGVNARTVWTIATQPFPGSHFAVMPPELAERCIRAGSAEGTTVLDPFGGAGTTALVANRLGRDAIICELNPDYAEMARARVHEDAPMFNQVKVVR